MTDGEAHKIAAFAVMVHKFRGWVFSMRSGLQDDEWGEIERLINRVSRRVDPTALCPQCCQPIGKSKSLPFCSENCRDGKANLEREKQIKKLRKAKGS